MLCGYCGKEHDGNYGSGRFCSARCARGFATKAKRKEINKKVSKKLMGHTKTLGSGMPKGYRFKKPSMSRKTIRKRSEAIKATNRIKRSKLPFEKLDERWQKEILLEECGHKCQECGQQEKWNGKKLVLQIHHIDGDGKNRTKKNSKIVCPNCHTQTETYGHKNRGKSKVRKR